MPLYDKPEDAESPLQVLLLRAVPKNQHGHKTMLELSRILGVSKWAIRKWVNAEKIPPNRVVEIVRLSKGRVKQKDFDEFVYKA